MSASCFIYDSESELAPFSPASSVSLMSVGSDPSPSPSPTSNKSPDHGCPRFNNIYEERLMPLLPSVSESNGKKPIPRPTHAKNFNQNIQSKFDIALRNSDYSEVEDLLSRHSEEVDVNLINDEGNTPLQTAALGGSLEMVRLLIRAGADPCLASRDGWSTLHIAAYSGHSEITQYIMVSSRR